MCTSKMNLTIFNVDINGTIIGFDSTDEKVNVDQFTSEYLARSIDKYGNILPSVTNNRESYYQWLTQNHKQTYKEDAYNVTKTFPQHKETHSKLIEVFNMGIFPSFLKLLNTKILNTNSVLVFRTFGSDGPLVIDKINQNKEFPINFIECQPKELSLSQFEECKKENRHILVQDNYNRWNYNYKDPKYGKIIIGDSNLFQYGFDDNDCMYPLGENVTFFKINTLRAAFDEDYFINLII